MHAEWVDMTLEPLLLRTGLVHSIYGFEPLERSGMDSGNHLKFTPRRG